MSKKGFFYLGKVNKTHGLKGRVTVYLDLEDPLYYQSQKVIYMELSESLVPFFVLEISHKKGNVFTILFQDLVSEEAAKLLVGNHMYLPVDQEKPTDDSFSLFDLKDYLLIDQNGNEIGQIISVEGTDLNPLALVLVRESNVYIPLQESLLIGINVEQSQVQVRVAEGLIDLQK